MQWSSRNRKKQVGIHNVVNYDEDAIAGPSREAEISNEAVETQRKH